MSSSPVAPANQHQTLSRLALRMARFPVPLDYLRVVRKNEAARAADATREVNGAVVA